jgi:hypothetical protein
MDADDSQRIVLGLLLEHHPTMLGLDELAEALPDIERVEEAVRVLVDDGLVRRLGDRRGLTRAAVRMHALDPI